MNLYDFILMFIFGVLAILLVFAYAQIRGVEILEKQRMVGGITVKVIGAVAFLLIYEYYFGYGGDAHSYYRDAMWFNNLLFQSPSEFLGYAFGSLEQGDLWSTGSSVPKNYHKGTKEFFVSLIFSFFTLLGIGNYYASTIMFAFVSFIGYWLLYLVFKKKYPRLDSWAYLCVFFLPSGVIWGSGLVKENLILFALGIFLFLVVKVEKTKGQKLGYLLLSGLFLFIIAKVKIYVLLSLLIGILVWLFPKVMANRENIVFRKIIRPISIVTLIGISLISIHFITQRFNEFTFSSFIVKAQSYQDWHYVENANTSEEHGRGSSYTLGPYDPTIIGTIKMIPASINVAFFRPYLWEVKSPIVFIVSVESLILLLFFLYIITRRHLYLFGRTIFSDSFLMMILVYSLVLGFLVGFTSYNFGALDRYKIPAMPFFVFSLFVVLNKIKTIKKLQLR